MKEITFDGNLSEVQRGVWGAVKVVTTNFFGNLRVKNYESLVEEFLMPTKSLDTKCH